MTRALRQSRSADSEASPDTRARLIEAAGEEFAENGFAKATVRDICAKAAANIAAVNYHFRDKETLYLETLRHAHRYSIEHYPHHGGLASDAPAKDRLRAFVRAFLAKMLDADRPKWHGRLISREMTEPTPALTLIIEEGVRPQFAALCAIVHELAPSLKGESLEASAASVIGQALHYHHCNSMIKRLYTERKDGFPFDLEFLTDHITRFSLAAFESIERAAGEKSKNRRGKH
ncbi:MAG: CerR family C-terminal domain-containing protein [Phycisphaerae bacterium]|nr:CerR family C-terminal domain-containing protein [Phycisphaerae bacterium]MBN8596543.1 CerR family C-terminal domain-containing protein [Planctomycetota bacterium]